MSRLLSFFVFLGCVAVLVACGERPQVLQTSKSDIPAFQGTANSFAVQGWKAGDRTSWEQGLKARLQNTQNEYTKLAVAKK